MHLDHHRPLNVILQSDHLILYMFVFTIGRCVRRLFHSDEESVRKDIKAVEASLNAAIDEYVRLAETSSDGVEIVKANHDTNTQYS